MNIQQYSIEKYAKELCEAVKAYNGSDGYPKVTYKFEDETDHPIIHDPKKGKWKFEYKLRYSLEVSHSDMIGVESLIKCQLRSSNWREVKHGLLNVIYWGFSGDQKSRRPSRVGEFYERVTKPQICDFMNKVNDSSEPKLVCIEKIGMPIFSNMSLVSKVAMFLDPNNYPVLDERISRLSHIDPSPVKDLKIYPTYIPIHPSGNRRDGKKPNCRIYEDWASWCQGIAHLMKQECDFPFRAVDVERGLFWLIGPRNRRISDTQRKNKTIAKQLIYCPQGYTHQNVIDLARKLATNP